jgi:aspartyl/asparaginyl-tRNA synthetase
MISKNIGKRDKNDKYFDKLNKLNFFLSKFFLGRNSKKEKEMTQLISPDKFTKTVGLLRSFFLEKGFLEVHTQNRLSILAACEDPFNVATYNYAGQVWPLPQTGQMWLEHELLSSPDSKGFFVSPLPIDRSQTQSQVDTI